MTISLLLTDSKVKAGIMYELSDPETGDPLAILDLAWPNGLQEGYSEPVALLIDEERETKEAANQAGYRFFTNVADFQTYVKHEILALTEETSAGFPPEVSRNIENMEIV